MSSSKNIPALFLAGATAVGLPLGVHLYESHNDKNKSFQESVMSGKIQALCQETLGKAISISADDRFYKAGNTLYVQDSLTGEISRLTNSVCETITELPQKKK